MSNKTQIKEIDKSITYLIEQIRMTTQGDMIINLCASLEILTGVRSKMQEYISVVESN
jgi:hypothetical protein